MAGGIQQVDPQLVADDWLSFPGGELEGKRPKAVCPACRATMERGGVPPRTLCFQCYRLELDRERALRAAATVDTASDARFQSQLPFEQVNRARLATLKAARAAARVAAGDGPGATVERRRQAQIAARHALQHIADGVKARRRMDAVEHAVELQLPDAWLPFVLSR
jgi:hypothetical protein